MGKLDFYDRGPDRPWANPQLTDEIVRLNRVWLA